MAISPQYRFCPKETFPAQVPDVKAAVRWLRAHAEEYKVDPDHIGAMGFSAGGHLSLMLGVTGAGRRPGRRDDRRAPPARRSRRWSTTSARPTWPRPTSPRSPSPWCGLPRRHAGREARGGGKASPVTFVTKDDPPILTFQGTKDPLVPHTQAIKLADALTAAGVPGRVELLVGAGHGWGGDDLKRTMDETYEFFDKYLKPH